MRRFHSYGPVDAEKHFCVPRTELVEEGFRRLVEGHFFTIFSPRQYGKTWLMGELARKIETEHPGKFIVGIMSMQEVVIEQDDPDEVFFRQLPGIVKNAFDIEPARLESWQDWSR